MRAWAAADVAGVTGPVRHAAVALAAPAPVRREERRRTSWADAAACKSMPTALWFAPDDTSQRIALALCRGCPVRADCLAAAVAEEAGQPRWGIRGGRTAAQRR
jgi:WhiB family redox-sensing transcriptional regulator